jgi:RNA polymerase sigma factor (sigma-70 family)
MTDCWDEIDDAELAQRARTEREAFGALYDRYLARMYRYCLRRCGNAVDAEDLTSAIFMRALERFDSFAGGSYAAWLFAIARRMVIDRYRRCGPVPETIDESIVDFAAGPEELAVQGDERARLHARLAELPEDQRSAIELRLAGLTGTEIAEVMERSVPAVKMLQVRAMKRLRELTAD